MDQHPLPAYSGPMPLCPKCGGCEANTDWCAANRVNPERLARTCRRCGYQWDEAPNDAQKAPTPTAPLLVSRPPAHSVLGGVAQPPVYLLG